MSVLDSLTNLFAPYDCLSCGREGSLLCHGCAERLPTVPERCFRCYQLTEKGRSCAQCQQASGLYGVRAVTGYTGVAKDLIWHLKYQGAQAAAKIMAHQMALLTDPGDDKLLVAVPTASGRARRRGYDQTSLLVRALSRETGVKRATALARQGQHHQVGADRQHRLRQLTDAFRVTQVNLVRDRRVIIVDDVLTTGATLTAVAAALRAAGAKSIEAVVFARA